MQKLGEKGKRMKKRYCAAILALMTLFIFGCGQKTDSASEAKEPVTITVWNYYSGSQQEAFNTLVSEFNKGKGKELGITVKASSEGNAEELEENVISAAKKEVGAKEIPNIFSAYADTAYRIDQMGLVEDISGYFTEEEKAEYIESYLSAGSLSTNEKELKIFPVAKATEIFMLNRTDWDKFEKATGIGLDALETIEGVTEIAEKYYEWTDSLTARPDDGKAFFGRDAMANYMLIGTRQLGTELVSLKEDGSVALDFPEDVARKLWDNYYVPYINGYFSAVGRFRSDDVKTGNVICFVGSSASSTFFPSEVILSDEESYPIEIGVLNSPKFAGGEDFAVQQGAGMVVVKGEEDKVRASVEFLKWFTDTEQNIYFSQASGYLPVKKEANDIEVIKKENEENQSVTESLEVSINTVNNNTLYTVPVFENASGMRNILEYSMSDKAAKDRSLVEEKMAEGISRQDAVAEFDTDENFHEWYISVKKQLESTIH